MKQNKRTELDVDFIGGQDPLTKEEEKAISDYINTHKAKRTRAPVIEKKRIVKYGKHAASL